MRRRALVAAALAAALHAAPAAATSPHSVVMFGEAGDPVAPGLHIYEGPEQISPPFGSEVSLPFGVGGPGARGFFTIEVAGPKGTKIAPGDYERAQNYPFVELGRPGISVRGSNRCTTAAGRFRVRQLRLDGAFIRRAWVLFEQHCERPNAPALFGEVRIGMPTLPGVLRVLPTALRWPPRAVGKRGTTVPFTFTARRRTRAGAALIEGAGRRAFRVTADHCRGRMLNAGATCRVKVRFTPRGAGPAVAQLRLKGGGRAATAELFGDTGVASVG